MDSLAHLAIRIDTSHVPASPSSPPLSPGSTDDKERSSSPELQSTPQLGARLGDGARIEEEGELETDPLFLRRRLVDEESILHMRRRKSTQKHLGAFYGRQNLQITSFLKPMDVHIAEAAKDEDENRLALRIAVNASLICNLLLLVLQLYAAISSLSLSFFATAIDAICDPAANIVMYYVHRKAQNIDLRRYPSGGAKFETCGEILFTLIMSSASVVLLVLSIQVVATHTADTPRDILHVPAIVAVGVSFLTKLALFFYCHPLRHKSSQVHILWEDHRNDVLINAFGLFTSSAGVKLAWWIDPLGAILISIGLIYLWGSSAYVHFTHLAGRSAPLEFTQLVIYNAMHFADDIEAIDSCTAYHSGSMYVVELDIVMHSATPLARSHDISQALQDKLEELPRVERAFVHVDHEVSHAPEHRKKV